MVNRLLIAVFLLPFLVSVGYTAQYPLESAEHEIFQKDSLYQYIGVIEDREKRERYIVNNKRGYVQGGISMDHPEKLIFEYTRMSFIGLAFLDRDPRSALFVGLGAGSMPRYFNKFWPDASVDIAEIDPDILAVAEKYFFFRPKENMKVYIDDGRVFIKRTKKKYDVIFLDAYQTDYIPFHLTTVEFLREVSSKLADDGVVVSNIVSPTKNKFFDSMVRTYREVFPHVYIFRGNKVKNYIFVATKSAVKKDRNVIAANAREIQSARKPDIDFHEISSAYAYYTQYEKKAELLTDDFAPVNIYKYMKSE